MEARATRQKTRSLLARSHNHGLPTRSFMRPSCRFQGNGEGLRFQSRRQGRIQNRGATVRVWPEKSGGDGTAACGNQPEFINLLRRQRRKI